MGRTEGFVAKNCSSFRRWSLSEGSDIGVESSLRKILNICRKLYKYLPLLFPTEIILQMQWKIIRVTDSYWDFTSFRILRFFYRWDDMRHFASAKFCCSLSWRNLPFSAQKQRSEEEIVGWTLYPCRAIYNIHEETGHVGISYPFQKYVILVSEIKNHLKHLFLDELHHSVCINKGLFPWGY